MRETKRSWMTILVGLMLLAASCTSDGLDDGDAADVVLEIVSMDNPAVTANTSTGASGTCTISGNACVVDADCADTGGTCTIPPAGCDLEVKQWTASVMNVPKNSQAGGDSIPYNDIILVDVVITYEWLNGEVMPTRVVGLGNVTVPAETTTSVLFEPVAFDDLSLAVEGSTANLTLMFRARTVEGTTITQTASRQLFVESCD